ncbi:MAG: SusC/RagA family TonB-linked outer membrane protein, partial [Bacteroidota bacterium]|nr:SusC/RagA family TonB-linked outer membrane protein [Bacteroidota bacterium]
MKTMKRRYFYILLLTALLTSSQGVFCQSETAGFTVKGIVVSAVTGKPLAGARVSMEGSKPAMTEETGQFELVVVKKEAMSVTRLLQVSVPGYATKKLLLNGSRLLRIAMNDETFKGMDQVLQTPFGVASSLFSPYATAAVSPNLSATTKSTPDALFQGSVSGLNTVFRSGQPGSGANMYLQGFQSMLATSQPLIIVDGVPYENFGFKSLISIYQTNPLSAIEVKDIESISVLKDGSGIYGGKGANGVILINTLSTSDPATKLEAHVHTGMSFVPKSFPVMNASQYRTFLGDMLASAGLSTSAIQNLPYINQEKPVADKYGRYSGNLDYYRYANNTDWQKSAYEMAEDQNYYLNVKGGDQTALYALSLGFLNQDGIESGTNYSRFNMRFNSDIAISQRFNAHTNMSFSYGTRSLQNEGPSGSYNLLSTSLIKAPISAAHKFDYQGNESPNLEEADVFGVSNPEAIASNIVLKNLNYRFLGKIGLDYTVNQNWRFDGAFSLHFNKDRERIFIPEAGIASDTLSNAIVLNQAQHRVERWFNLYGEGYATYTKNFGIGTHLMAHGGMRYQSVQSENDYAYAYNSSSDEFKSIQYGDLNLRKIGGSLGRQNWMSFFADADLTLKNKFLFSAILSSDASSRYNSMRLFPTLSGAWLLSSEPFMSKIEKIDFLKVRLNAGLSGNDDIGNYSQKTYYVAQSFLGNNGLVLGGIPNAEIGPEMLTKTSIGLDGSFFKERLQVSLDAYHHVINDMLTLSHAMPSSGFDYYLSNGGAMKNDGLDLTVNGRIVNSAIKWDLGLTISRYKNEVTRLDCGTLESDLNGATVQTKVGQPIGVFYGYQTNGVYTTQEEAGAAGKYIMDGSV